MLMILFTTFLFSCGEEVKLQNAVQDEFETARNNFYSKYVDAPNQIKKSDVFNESRKHTCLFEQKHGRTFYDWEGEIDAISTNQGGDEISYFAVTSIKSSISYKQFDIKRGSALYNQIAEFKEGDKIKFDFKFNDEAFSTNVKECFDELSITEDGSLSDPEFSVSFLTIKKVK
jgi:Cu/Ag efflux protein CusF